MRKLTKRIVLVIISLILTLMMSMTVPQMTSTVNAAATGDQLADYAKSCCVGIPYKSGGRTLKGFDCCGLVWYVCNHFGINIGSGNQNSQRNYGTAVSYSLSSFDSYLSSLKKGDLIFFDYFNSGSSQHVGIYVGGGYIVNAESSDGVSGISRNRYMDVTWNYGKKLWQHTCAVRRVAGGTVQHTLNISPNIKPTSFKIGQVSIVGGKVESTGSPITYVSGGVYTNKEGTGSCVNGIFKEVKNLNTFSYNLSYIDRYILFNNISQGGNYYFVVKAKTSQKTDTKAIPFTVQGNTCGMPSISFTDVSGGKRLTVSGGSNDTVNYVIKKDGTQIASGSAGGSYSTTLNTKGNYTVSAYSTRSGYTKSGTKTATVNIAQVEAPIIGQSVTGNNIVLNMKSNTSGATIYYTTSGNNPSTNSTKYSGAATVNSNRTIKAIAVKNGCVNSNISVTTVKLEEPSAPTGFSLSGESIVAAGSNISVKWDENVMASEYVVTLYKDGTEVKSNTTSGTVSSFNLSDAGKYQLKIYASNFVGNGAESDTILEVEAKAPSKVEFVDWNDQVIKSQEVPYGGNATLPSDPERRGYTFVSWENGDKLENIKNDLIVKATYKINTYSVKFYDASGNQVGSTQKVQYGSSAESPESKLTDIPTGYVFAGWKVLESGNDSLGNYREVDSDMKLQAIYYWGNEELPVVTSITSATRNSSTGNYNVEVNLTNYPKEATTAILRVSLLTSEGKMVKSGKEEIEIEADSTINKTMTLKYSGVATKASVVILGLKDDNLTGSAYSKAVTKEVTEISDYVWSDWSDWSTESAVATDDMEVETKTQYRYADKSTTTSTSSSLSGWTLYDTKTSWGSYGNWSGWSTTAQTASDAKQVESRTEYRYYAYVCPTCGGREPFKGTSDCGKYSLGDSNWTQVWSTVPYKNSNYKSYSYTTSKYYTESLGDGKRWNFGAANVNSTTPGTIDSGSSAVVIRKTYRYRTRTQTTTYYYYQWGNWSDWADKEYTSSDSRKVETRTVYRTRTKVPVHSDIEGTEETGQSFDFSGTLPVDADLNGKLATIMVYKGKNTDPNEDQIQFVGQTTIGNGNSYAFTVIPKAEPSDISGDYTVCLGLEGSTGLINVDMIQAPKATYTVKYMDEDGTEISSQNVKEGENAVVPTSPKKAGHVFVGWNINAMNVQSNLSITAVYAPLQYMVAFVDSANNVISFETYQYGETIVPPETPQAEGYEFIGWDCIIDNNNIVKGNMVANAVYKTDTFKVDFVDENNKIISSQNIEFGQTAMPPAALDVEGKEFLGWSTDVEWWNVKQNMTVKPILTYLETANAPSVSFEEFGDYVAAYLESPTEESKLYYALDYTNPNAVEEDVSGVIDESEAESVNDNEDSDIEGDSGDSDTESETDEIKYVQYNGEPIIIENFDIESELDESTEIITQLVTSKLKVYATCENMNDSEVEEVIYNGTRRISAKTGEVITGNNDGNENNSTSNTSSDIKVSKITIKSSLSNKIAAGKKVQLVLNIVPSNATNQTVVWKSSNTKVATVDQNGKVSVLKNTGGKKVTITARTKDGSGKQASYVITSMKGAVKKISISGNKSVKAGKSLKLKAKMTATKGANKKLKWTSSNLKYAKVSSSGKVTTYKAGKGKKVKIIAMATDGSGKKKTVTIKIK